MIKGDVLHPEPRCDLSGRVRIWHPWNELAVGQEFFVSCDIYDAVSLSWLRQRMREMIYKREKASLRKYKIVDGNYGLFVRRIA